MKRFAIFVIAAALAMPGIAFAGKTVDEYGEEFTPDVVEQVAPATAPAAAKKGTAPAVIQEKNVGTGAAKAPPKAPAKAKTSQGFPAASAPQAPVTPVESAPPAPAFFAKSREGRFQAGFVGPGFAYVSRGYGPAMTFGLEGDYFFFEKFAAGMRFEFETKFKSPTIISIVPHGRYVFDFDRHPRWSAYLQAGVGLAISAGSGTYVACDIAIPAGGFWWQWNDSWSVGAETSLHIYARSSVAVGWNIAPTVRYLF